MHSDVIMQEYLGYLLFSFQSPKLYISIICIISHYRTFHDLRFIGAKRGVLMGRIMNTEIAASKVQRIKVSLSDDS